MYFIVDLVEHLHLLCLGCACFTWFVHWYMHCPLRADLLFLLGLTSSVCVVSEVIKKLERLRGREKMADTDDFHDVWHTLCPVQEMVGGAGACGLECGLDRSHTVRNNPVWSVGSGLYVQFLFFTVKTRSWLWSYELVLAEMSPLARGDALVCCFMTVLLPIASGRTLFMRYCICPYSGCLDFMI